MSDAGSAWALLDPWALETLSTVGAALLCALVLTLLGWPRYK